VGVASRWNDCPESIVAGDGTTIPGRSEEDPIVDKPLLGDPIGRDWSKAAAVQNAPAHNKIETETTVVQQRNRLRGIDPSLRPPL
jgi:hypothetical protein